MLRGEATAKGLADETGKNQVPILKTFCGNTRKMVTFWIMEDLGLSIPKRK